MFEWLGGNEKGFITKDDVRNLSRDEMRALILEFEGTDVSNTEEAEYGIIDVAQIRYILIASSVVTPSLNSSAHVWCVGGHKHLCFVSLYITRYNVLQLVHLIKRCIEKCSAARGSILAGRDVLFYCWETLLTFSRKTI